MGQNMLKQTGASFLKVSSPGSFKGLDRLNADIITYLPFEMSSHKDTFVFICLVFAIGVSGQVFPGTMSLLQWMTHKMCLLDRFSFRGLTPVENYWQYALWVI